MPEDNIIKLNSTKDYNSQLFNVINNVTENDNDFKDFLSKKYFSLEQGAVVGDKAFLNFTEFRERSDNYNLEQQLPSFAGDKFIPLPQFKTDREEDIKTFFDSQKPGKHEAYLSQDKKDFDILSFVNDTEKQTALNEFKQRQAELYVDTQDLNKEQQKQLYDNVANGLVEIFNGDEKYINLYKEALKKDNVTLEAAKEMMPPAFIGLISRGLPVSQRKTLARELKSKAVNAQKVLENYIIEETTKLDTDSKEYIEKYDSYEKDRISLDKTLDDINDQLDVLGFQTKDKDVPIVLYSQDQAGVDKVNNIYKQRADLINNFYEKHDPEYLTNAHANLTIRHKNYEKTSESVNNADIAITALGKEYNWSRMAEMSLDVAFSDMALLGGFFAEKGGLITRKSYDDMISVNESIKNRKETLHPLPVNFSDMNTSNFGDVVSSVLAENIFSIGTALTYSGVLKFAGAKSVAATVAKRAVQGAFFSVEGGGHLSEIEIRQKTAKKQIPLLKAKLETSQSKEEKNRTLLQLESHERALDITNLQKTINPLLYGGIATLAETFGTLGILQRLNAMPIGKKAFKNILRTGRFYGFNVGVEYVEEFGTQFMHNFADYVVLKENKSFFEGIDANFNMNVLFSTLAIQGPSVGQTAIATIRDEFQTFRGIKQNRKYAEQFFELNERVKNAETYEAKLVAEGKLNELLEEVNIKDAEHFTNIAEMNNEDIFQVLENNRIVRDENQKIKDLAVNQGIGLDSRTKEELKKIQDNIVKLKSKNEELLNKPSKERDQAYKDIVQKETVDAENLFYFSQAQHFINLLKGTNDVKVFEAITFEDMQVKLNDLLSKGSITVDDYNDYIKGFRSANASFVQSTNEILILRSAIVVSIENSKNIYEKAMHAYSAVHEAQHMYDIKQGVVKNREVVETHKAAMQELVKSIDQLDQNSEEYKTAKQRLDQYTKNGKLDLREVKTIFGELINAGVITKEDDNTMYYFRSLFNSALRAMPFGKKIFPFIKLKTAEDVLSYIRNFQKQITEGGVKLQLPPEEDVKVSSTSFSKGVVDQINDLIPENVKTKEDYLAFLSDPRLNKEIGKALAPGGLIYNQVMQKALPDARSKVLDEINDRIINYDPGAKRKKKSDAPITFAERIFSDIRFGKMEAAKELATKPRTTTIDQPSETGRRSFDIADDVQEQEQELTPEQLESQIKKDLNLTDEVIEKVKQAVRKTYGTKLPDIRSKKYRTQLKDALIVELKKEIQDIFGREQDYNKFLRKYIPTLHKTLNADRWVQIERRVPKGKKIFVDSKRITSVKEVRKLQEQGLIRKDVKPASGPNLNTKLKTPNNEQIMAFFRGTNMQEVLGYTVGKSTFGTRKDGLAEAVVEKVGFDATINILNKELNIVERMRGVQEITGIEQLENDVQVIADVLDVNPGISLSLGITGMQTIEQFNELLTLAQNSIDQFLALENKLKYKGVPILSAIYDPIKQLHNKGGLEKDSMLNTALKKVFGSIVKLKGEKNLGDVGERVVYELFEEAGFLAPGHQLSEKKVNIKPFFTFKGGKFQNADIVFVLDNGQEVALEIKFAASGTVNAGKITISSYDSKGNFTFSDNNLPQKIKDLVAEKAKEVLKVVKEFENILINDFGYPKGINLNDIYLPEVSPYKNKEGKYLTIFEQAGKSNLWHPKIEAIKKKSNFTVNDDGSVSTYLYNKKGNFYALFIGEGKGKGLYYLGQDPLNTAQELGVTSVKGGHGVKFRLLAESKIDKNGNKTYGFRLNVEAFFNTNNIEKTSGFNIRNKKNVQQFKTAVNKSVHAKKNISMSKAAINSRTVNKPKGITILDFDDTLATSESLVKYTTPQGDTGTLNAEQYASTYQDLQDQGYVFDFSEFNKVVKGKVAPLFKKALKLQGKFGPQNMFVLTARPAVSAQAIFDFLKANGLNIPIENITGLGNSTAEAKALWVADKAAQGYNDFYFADDALQNVQAVKNMLDQFDVKSKIQQAKVSFSEGMSDRFNDIIEDVTSIESRKRFSEIKARKRGSSKGKFRYFIPPSHEDLVGLLYNFIGKGKKGDAHRDFFEKALIKPLNRAFREYDTARQSIASDYKSLNKQYKDVKDMFTKKTPDGDFTYQDAIRVYLWDKHGHAIPGISETDQANLANIVKNDARLLSYAEALNVISKRSDYVAPAVGWEAFNIKMDLIDATDRVGRAEFFAEFQQNADIIFSQENLNKIEAAYGKGVRNALEDMLYRIKLGKNRPKGQNAIVNALTNFVNAAVGTVMFFNIRSLVLQQMSIVNFINYADNNIFQAAKVFANQKQYWNDWSMLFNSDFMKQRRGGIRTDVNGAELASEISESEYPIRSLIRKLLQLGFKPTQIGDNIAIATGGALFYRNRVNTYKKEGLGQAEAERRAFADFQEISEATQQSARPDMVSQQQASDAGKWILAFQNVTSQFNRLGKKAFLDMYNRRITPPNKTLLQSDISNSSRILYYFAVQNLIFYGLQSALFFMMFDDDPEDEKLLSKQERMLSGSIDSVLRGSGVLGAAVSTLKNMAIKFSRERDKDYNFDESSVIMELANFSPPLGIKLRKIVNAEKTLNYNENIISEMELLDSDNPQWSAVTNYIEALTNVPANRLYNKTKNLGQALNSQNEAWQRSLMFLGWSQYNLGIQNEAIEEYKKAVKSRKSLRKPFKKQTFKKKKF